MAELTYDDLDNIIHDALVAFEFAEHNFDKLSNRPVACKLFGPDAHGIGAVCPSHLVSDKARKLTVSTRRNSYIAYELDDNHQILSNRIVDDGVVDCSYYHFELNGIHYARGFGGNENTFYTNVVYCLKYENQTPLFYAEASPSFLYIEFYQTREATESRQCFVTSYLYHPKRKYSEIGVLLSRESPLGAANSPVKISTFMKKMPDVDFAKFFQKD